MSPKETLLYRITELMFEKQQTFLLLDELYEDEVISSFVWNIQIDSPYQQLLFDGVLSQYNHQNEIVVSFTIEAYFHHLLAKVLQKDVRYQKAESLLELIQNNNLSGLKEGVSNLFSFDVELEVFNRLNDFINFHDDFTLDLCLNPFVKSMLENGVNKTLNSLLNFENEKDWKFINDVSEFLNEKDLNELYNELQVEAESYNFKNNIHSIKVHLKYIKLLRKDECKEKLILITTNKYEFIKSNKNVVEIADLFAYLGFKKEAIKYYDIALSDAIDIKPYEATKILGKCISFLLKFNYFDLAIKYLEIQMKLSKNSNSITSSVYHKLGLGFLGKKDYIKSNQNFEIALRIMINSHGSYHTKTASIYINLGVTYRHLGKHVDSLECYKKAEDIYVKKKYADSRLASLYRNISIIYMEMFNYIDAIIYEKKALEIRMKIFNLNDTEVKDLIQVIGDNLFRVEKFREAIEYYSKGNLTFQIAQCYEKINEFALALDFYLDYFQKRLKHYSLDDEWVRKSLFNAKRLAKQLNKENELPQWIKNIN